MELLFLNVFLSVNKHDIIVLHVKDCFDVHRDYCIECKRSCNVSDRYHYLIFGLFAVMLLSIRCFYYFLSTV